LRLSLIVGGGVWATMCVGGGSVYVCVPFCVGICVHVCARARVCVCYETYSITISDLVIYSTLLIISDSPRFIYDSRFCRSGHGMLTL